MAITSAGAPVSAATQATKQRWNCLGIEGRKNIAEVVVGGRSITKRPEPAKKLDLLLAEPRDVGECLRSAKHRKQAQQQTPRRADR